MRVQLKTLLAFAAPLLLAVIGAYVQWLTCGLPAIPPGAQPPPVGQPQGFPGWLRITHYVNFLFLILLVRSGLQILMDHPRLYWNLHCTPGSEWLRLTGDRAAGPGVDGKGGFTLPVAVDRLARRPPHGGHGTALAFPERAVLGD